MATFHARRNEFLEKVKQDQSLKGSFDFPIRDFMNDINANPHFFTTSSCSGRTAVFFQRTDVPSPPPLSSSSSSEGGESMELKVKSKKKKRGAGGWLYVTHGKTKFSHMFQAINRLPFVDRVLEPPTQPLDEEDEEPAYSNEEVCMTTQDLQVQEEEKEQQVVRDATVFFKFEPFVLHVECENPRWAASLHTVAVQSGFRESGISLGKKKVMVAIRSAALRLEIPIVDQGSWLVDANYLLFLSRLSSQRQVQNFERFGLLHNNFLKLNQQL